MIPKPRIESVDALRGLLAAGIMVFHVCMWTNLLQNPPLKNFWNWLGIYGVEMFFIVSGFSMAYVYLDKPLLTKAGLKDFYWKRFMRLWPLYVAAYLVATVFRVITNDPEAFNPLFAFLHITLLFGFVDPSIKGIIGGWSIGVEVVCYALFPVLLWSFRYRAASVVLMALLASCCIWFGLFLRPDDVLADKWPVYVFPLNHLFLFAVGCFFAKIFLDRRPSKAHTLTQAGTLIASVAAIFSPLAMTDTATVSGVGRLIFVILSLAMCWISITLVETPKALARFLNPLGLWSYSVYLLHPFMFQGLKLIKLDSQPAIHAILTILGTLVLAKFSYQYLEKPSVDWARRKADQWFKPQTEPISDSSGK